MSLLCALLAAVVPAAAQTPPPGAPPAETAPTDATAPPAASTAPAPAAADEEEVGQPPKRDSLLPRLDLFFPEADLDLRVSRLINKVFFEGQVKYNFIKGDITAFLRYRYYGFKRTTQFTVFDAIEFADVKDFSSDFDRVRGSLLFWQWPHSYTSRTFALVELDRISSNKEEVASSARSAAPW